MWYKYNDNVSDTRYMFSFVPEYSDKYVIIIINRKNLDCSMVIMDEKRYELWVKYQVRCKL